MDNGRNFIFEILYFSDYITIKGDRHKIYHLLTILIHVYECQVYVHKKEDIGYQKEYVLVSFYDKIKLNESYFCCK